MDSCKTCKYWQGNPLHFDGKCTFAGGNKARFWIDGAGDFLELRTEPDFYCNHWESKDEIK